MCGISGFVNWTEQMPLKPFINAHGLLKHRGRDDEGFFTIVGDIGSYLKGDESVFEIANLPHVYEIEEANLAFGHWRLSIIDLTAGGHQPMVSRTGRFTITYNGEIYNYVELRDELRKLGHDFVTDSDTEVLLACFEEWGTDCVNRLNGMWAFALFDQLKERVIFSRDRFGIKPLYYVIVGDTLYFASEIKALLPQIAGTKMSQERAMEYLVSGFIDHHEQTMFEGIRQLLPGHCAIWDRNGLRVFRYWNLPDSEIRINIEDAVERLAALLTSSVELRLRSDVPIGTLLSGGLDSTTIACLVGKLRRPINQKAGFDVFSAIFEEEAFSERVYIEETIAQTKLPIHWIYPIPGRLGSELPKILYQQELPIRSLSVFSQWTIMKYVEKSKVKVLLNGQGADELFAGYTQHYYALIAKYIFRLRLLRAWGLLDFLHQEYNTNYLRGFLQAFANLWRLSSCERWGPFRQPDYLTCRYQPDLKCPQGKDLFDRKLIQNLTITALPEYLRYEDRNSMAFTLESRLPFLDYRLVEWAMSLPSELKINGPSSKHVLRQMALPMIPRSVSQRRDKMGFVTPQEHWQRNELRPMLDDVFSQDLQSIFPFIDQKRVKEKYLNYQENGIGDWAWVWRIACLYWWHQLWWDNQNGK